jgi:hypothetical protein
MKIFVTTCSMNKIDGGNDYSYYGWSNERKTDLLQRRRRVLEMMQTKALKSSLRLPVEGPDFGATAEGGQYLPARKRYSEGAFIRGLVASGRKLSDWEKTNRLYFVSALYGLVNSREPIQNYDLDLHQPQLLELWKDKDVLTNALLRDLRDLRQVCNVIDCCVNDNYVAMIEWARLTEAGHEVRHVMKSGEFTTRQIRWTVGHLAGDNRDRLLDLVQYEECRYTSDNGSVTLSKVITAMRQAVPSRPLSGEISSHDIARPSVAVAYHRPSQKESFITHARKRGWGNFFNFEFVNNLNKETLETLDRHGVRTLIIHVDDTHSHLQKAYKTPTTSLEEELPKDWTFRKVKNERYSDVQLELRARFKN